MYQHNSSVQVWVRHWDPVFCHIESSGIELKQSRGISKNIVIKNIPINDQHFTAVNNRFYICEGNLLAMKAAISIVNGYDSSGLMTSWESRQYRYRVDRSCSRAFRAHLRK